MIRRVASPDNELLDRLATLHQRAFAPHARGWTAAEITALAAECDLYLSEQGFLIMRTVLDEAEVLTIAVDPSDQGQGVGRALLAHGLEAHQNKTVFLEVAADNKAALTLYSSCGFEEVGRRKGYYRRSDERDVDGLTMRRLPG